MIFVICVPIIIVIIFVIVLLFISQKNIINEFDIKTNEAINSINIYQDKHIVLLSKISKLINKDSKEKILKNLSKVKNKKLNMFELQDEIHKLNNELKDYLDDSNFKFNENAFLKKELDNNYVEINALINYYNNLVINYNATIKKINFLIIKLIKKLHILETFEIKKDVEFEILKNDNV